MPFAEQTQRNEAKITAYIRALATTEWDYKLLQTDDGSHYAYSTLDPGVPNHLGERVKILAREFYPVVWKIFLDQMPEKKRLLVLLGAPGIGKSVGLGMGYLLAMILQNTKTYKLGVSHICYTSPRHNCWVYDLQTQTTTIFGTGFTQAGMCRDFTDLLIARNSVWFIDEKEHGPFDDCAGFPVGMYSGKEKNYDITKKCTYRRFYWVAAWDGRTRKNLPAQTVNGYPASLEALRLLSYQQLPQTQLADRFRIVGPFPRDLHTGFNEAVQAQKIALSTATLDSFTLENASSASFATGKMSFRVLYPDVEREYGMLKRHGVPASEHVVHELYRRAAETAAGQAVATIQARLYVKEARLSVGKQWEVQLVAHLSASERVLTVQPLEPGKRGPASSAKAQASTQKLLTLPGGSAGPDTPTLQRVDHFFRYTPEKNASLFWWSFKETEAAVDFLLRSADHRHLFLGQVTTMERHPINGLRLVEIIKHMQLKEDATIEFGFLVPKSQLQVTKCIPLVVTCKTKAKPGTTTYKKVKAKQKEHQIFLDSCKIQQYACSPLRMMHLCQ